MCFPSSYEPREILTDGYGEIIDNEDPWSLYNVLLYNDENNIPWPDPEILAIVVEWNGEEVYIYRNQNAMYFSHLFFGTPLYVSLRIKYGLQ